MVEKQTNISEERTRFSRFLATFPFLGYLAPHEFKKFMLLFDIFIIIGSFLIAIIIRNIYRDTPDVWYGYFVFFPQYLAIWLGILYFLGIYKSFKAKKTYEILLILFKSILFGYVFWTVYMHIFKVDYFNIRFIIFTFFLTAVSISIEKLAFISLFRYQAKKGINFRRILIIGSGERAKHFIDLNNKNAEWNIEIVGILDEEDRVGTVIGDNKVVGSLNDIAKIIEENVVDEVFFIIPRKWLSRVEDYIMLCEKIGIRVSIAADFFTPLITKLKTTELYGLPFLTIDTTLYNVWHLYIKRIFDISISLIVLIVNLPVFLIVAIAIKLTSPGPVLFKQKRLGLHGRIFTLYKFRTMIEGADRMLDEVKHLSESRGPVFHSRKDPRITPIGRFLRMASLDELPQLLNVIKGDMSIIGPRPPLPEETKQYEKWQKRRLSLRPGIVCTWQVTKRFQPDFGEWMQMDLDYIDNWSLALDFKVFLKIIPAILRGFRFWLSKKV